jgi:hypothetical protein
MYQRTKLALDTWLELSKTAATPSTIISETTAPTSGPTSEEGSLPVLMVGPQGGALPRLGYLARGPSTTSAALAPAVAPVLPVRGQDLQATSPPPPALQQHQQQQQQHRPLHHRPQGTSALGGSQQRSSPAPDTAEAVGDNMTPDDVTRPAKRVCM